MTIPNPKKKIQEDKPKEKTIELQTLELTRPGSSDKALHDAREKPRPEIILENFPSPQKAVKAKMPSFQEESLPEVTSAITEAERIEWKIALVFSGLAVAAAVFFDLI